MHVTRLEGQKEREVSKQYAQAENEWEKSQFSMARVWSRALSLLTYTVVGVPLFFFSKSHVVLFDLISLLIFDKRAHTQSFTVKLQP